MGLPGKLLKGLGRRAMTKAMDRVGGRLVSRIADTSADAPSSFTEPKRDVYRHMQEGNVALPPKEGDEGEAEDAHDHGHAHDHDED